MQQKLTLSIVASSRPSVFNQGDSATGAVTDFLSRLESDADSK